MTTHNSYAFTLDPKGSIIEQLDSGIRGIELDIVDKYLLEMVTGRLDKLKTILNLILFRLTKPFRFHFMIGHWIVGGEVSRMPGNPRGNKFKDWLSTIADWSRKKEENGGHAPITVFLDIKAGLHEKDNSPPEKYGLIRFNEEILEVFEDDEERLFTLEDFKEHNKGKETSTWPSIEELRNRIILVLMGFHYETEPAVKALSRIFPQFFKKTGSPLGLPLMKTRIAYQEGMIESKKIKQICFVAFNEEDQGKEGYKESLKTESLFATLHPPDDYAEYWRNRVIVRANYDGAPPDYINFPATDHWQDKKYREATNWVR